MKLEHLFVCKVTPEHAEGRTVLLDKATGVPARARYAGVISVRPGLEGVISFYASLRLGKLLLLMMSDGKTTRYYLLSSHYRESFMALEGTDCVEEGMRVLFLNLLRSEGQVAIRFYNKAADFFHRYFMDCNTARKFAVNRPDWHALLEWDPAYERGIRVTVYTMTGEQDPVALPLNYHPMTAVQSNRHFPKRKVA